MLIDLGVYSFIALKFFLRQFNLIRLVGAVDFLRMGVLQKNHDLLRWFSDLGAPLLVQLLDHILEVEEQVALRLLDMLGQELLRCRTPQRLVSLAEPEFCKQILLKYGQDVQLSFFAIFV